MRAVLLIAALSIPLAASAQASKDANPRIEQNTQGAEAEGNALDPATQARIRAEGAAGGVKGGIKADTQKDPGRSVGHGNPNLRDHRPRQAGEGRVHDETSSDPEKGRGARGLIR